MKVVYVRESKSRGYTVLGIDAGEGARAYTVETSLYVRIGAPLSSDELDERAFADVSFSDECYRATKKALSLLAFSDKNRRTLSLKLLRDGFSRDAVDAAVADMLRNGYINERRQLERLIETEIRINLSGRRKLVPKLVAKGYSKSDVEETLDELIESGALDLEAAAKELVLKKLGESPAEDDVKRLLYKNGFSGDYDL